MFDFINDLRTHKHKGIGPDGGENGNVIPSGLSRFSCTGFVGIAFLDLENRAVVSMFSLEPGRIHVVRCPDNVLVVLECESDVEWFVSFSNRFNKSDPTRVESTLLRPRTPEEEMQDYLNEVAARASSAEIAQGIRRGEIEIDMTNEDFTEEYEEDEIAPLSVYQMQNMLDIINDDLLRAKEAKAKQKDIEEEAPPVDLKAGAKGAVKKAAPAASKASEPPAVESAEASE